MSAARTLAALLAATLLAACDSGPAKPDRAPPPRPTARAAASASSGGAPAPSTSIAAPPVDQGARAAAGAWEGHFDAKKGSVTVPENVKDKAREGDDGKAAVGSGKVEIAIAPDGDVTGSWTGALGKDTLRGKVETDGGRTMLRASAMPEDPTAAGAMTGILVAELKGDVFHAEIHVAAGDAVTVREASFDLVRKR